LTVLDSTTKARPRRSPNRVRLVNVDGSPATGAAATWGPETDAYRWAPTDRESDCAEPETDAQWLARIAREEAEERIRVETTYQPSPTDLAEFAAWSEALDNGTLPPAEADRFTLGESCFSRDEMDAIRRNQVSHDELCMLAAGMPI
jgi:hypothetical protein